MTPQYWAGFFDGEGCVRIQKQRNGRYADSYALTVSLSNTDRGILDRLRETFVGVVQNKRTTSNKAWWSPAWAWRIHGNAAVDFLEAIEPFAIVKHSEIAIALEYQRGVNPGNSRPISASERARRDDCYRRLKTFKTHRPRWADEVA